MQSLVISIVVPYFTCALEFYEKSNHSFESPWLRKKRGKKVHLFYLGKPIYLIFKTLY